jgi:uncharacterized protein (DUF2252 family)
MTAAVAASNEGFIVNICESVASYEEWLRSELQGEIVEEDLLKKHEKMRESKFAFLRATYWRWAEVMPSLMPELNATTTVLAVGDIHVENFGTWRDADGRLVWGLNDFDEACEMPYAWDVLRLAVSGYLGQSDERKFSLASICECVLKGYSAGLEAPKPFILDRDHVRMREKFVATETERSEFWQKMDKKKSKTRELPSDRFREALEASLLDDAEQPMYWPRSAGVGSLGRPRWVAYAQWKGGPVVREAKAIVPSAWSYARQAASSKMYVTDISQVLHRAQDPWYHLTERNVLVRRLSPNNHKIEMDVLGDWMLEQGLLTDMARELANIHLGRDGIGVEISIDLDRHDQGWLLQAAHKAVQSVEDDFCAFSRSPE